MGVLTKNYLPLDHIQRKYYKDLNLSLLYNSLKNILLKDTKGVE